MKKIILSIVSLLTALALTSCFEAETTIHLKKDGSGTLVKELRLGKKMLQIPAEDLKKMFSEAEKDARDAAMIAKMGEGVTFAKFEPNKDGDAKGWRTTYHFEDINKLRVSFDLDMEMEMELADPDSAKVTENDVKPFCTFDYNDGVLTITPTPQPKDNAEAAGINRKEPGEQELGMMKAMLDGMKVVFKVTMEPGIAETNATHRDGDTITLFDYDVCEVLTDPENTKKLGALDQENPEKNLGLLKNLKGSKAEMKPQVTVKLK
jgi:hypothetical protein